MVTAMAAAMSPLAISDASSRVTTAGPGRTYEGQIWASTTACQMPKPITTANSFGHSAATMRRANGLARELGRSSASRPPNSAPRRSVEPARPSSNAGLVSRMPTNLVAQPGADREGEARYVGRLDPALALDGDRELGHDLARAA